MYFESLSEGEKAAFRKGQQIAIEEMLSYIAEIEATRNPNSSHGKAQLYILRELVGKITEE